MLVYPKVMAGVNLGRRNDRTKVLVTTGLEPDLVMIMLNAKVTDGMSIWERLTRLHTSTNRDR